MKALMGRINKTLNIFEPIIFPTAISFFFFIMATMDVANSGNEVPGATISSPTIFSLIPISHCNIYCVINHKLTPDYQSSQSENNQ